jgi:hypothetical protein
VRHWWLAAGLSVAGSLAWAQPAWFTVVGDPLDKAADTVQVDPNRIAAPPPAEGEAAPEKPLIEMNVRVNRSGPRFNWDRIPYRSYESRVVFDCHAKSATYVQARFYAEPLWRGEPHQVADYSAAPKPMRFLDMTPNPTARIVRAACRMRAS